MPWEAQERWRQFDLTFQELNKTSNDTLSDVQVQPTRFYRQGSICKGKRERGYEVSESVRCLDAFSTEQLTEESRTMAFSQLPDMCREWNIPWRWTSNRWWLERFGLFFLALLLDMVFDGTA